MTSRRVLAHVEWVGRAPPAVARFSAVGRFDAQRDRWPREAWSVVLFAPDGGFAAAGEAEVALLMPDGPMQLLQVGCAFDVMDGPRVAARARVVGNSKG